MPERPALLVGPEAIASVASERALYLVQDLAGPSQANLSNRGAELRFWRLLEGGAAVFDGARGGNTGVLRGLRAADVVNERGC